MYQTFMLIYIGEDDEAVRSRLRISDVTEAVVGFCEMMTIKLGGRYAGVTCALSWRHLGVTWSLRGRYMGVTWALRGLYLGCTKLCLTINGTSVTFA